jgi:hypothetical protein
MGEEHLVVLCMHACVRAHTHTHGVQNALTVLLNCKVQDFEITMVETCLQWQEVLE